MPFAAKYPGRCDDCLEEIRIGDPIVGKPSGLYVHEVCPVSPVDLQPGETVCDRCWLVHPEGKCDA